MHNGITGIRSRHTAQRVKACLLLVSVFFGLAISGNSQDYYAEGILKLDYYVRQGTVLEKEKFTHFNVTVQGCKYKICMYLSGTTNHFDWYFDGQALYRMLFSPPVATNAPGAAFPSQMKATNLTQKALYPLYVDEGNKVPPDDGSNNQYIWLAFASHCYFRELGTNKLASPWRPDDPTLSPEETQKDIFLTLHQDAPATPERVVYMSDGLFRGYDPVKKKPIRIKLPPPFEAGFTNAVYEAASWITISNLSVPKDFTFIRYGTPVASNNGHLWPRMVLRGRVTNIVAGTRILEFKPEFAGKATVYDYRIKGSVEVKTPKGVRTENYSHVPYFVSNSAWPSPESLSNATIRHEDQIRQSTLAPFRRGAGKNAPYYVLAVLFLISAPFVVRLWKGLQQPKHH